MKPNFGHIARICFERCEELEARCQLLLREARRYREERDELRAAENERDWDRGTNVN